MAARGDESKVVEQTMVEKDAKAGMLSLGLLGWAVSGRT